VQWGLRLQRKGGRTLVEGVADFGGPGRKRGRNKTQASGGGGGREILTGRSEPVEGWQRAMVTRRKKGWCLWFVERGAIGLARREGEPAVVFLKLFAPNWGLWGQIILYGVVGKVQVCLLDHAWKSGGKGGRRQQRSLA